MVVASHCYYGRGYLAKQHAQYVVMHSAAEQSGDGMAAVSKTSAVSSVTQSQKKYSDNFYPKTSTTSRVPIAELCGEAPSREDCIVLLARSATSFPSPTGSDFPLVLFTSVSQFKALLADEDALALHVSAQAPVLNAAKRPRASSDADGPTPPNSPSRFPPFDAAAASAQVAPAHVETASAHAVAVLSARIDRVESSASGTYASFSRLQAAVTDLTEAKVRADADLATVMATLGRVQETVAASADFSAWEDVKRDIAALWARVPPDVKHYLAMTNLYFYRVGEKKQLTNDGLSAAQILSEELSRFNKVLMLLKLLFPTPVLAVLNGFRAHVPSNKKGDSKIPVIVAEFASSRDAEAFLVLWAKIDFDSKMWDMWTVDNKRPTCFKFSGTAPELIKPYDAFDSVILTI